MFAPIKDFMHFNEVKTSFEHFPEICNFVAATANGEEVMALLGPELAAEIEACEFKVCAMLSGDMNNMGFAVFHEETMEAAILMYLNGLTTEDLPAMLKHELVHCKQYESGRLRIVGNQIYWEGKPHKSYSLPSWEPINDEGRRQYLYEHMRYSSQPWEMEANADVWELVYGKIPMLEVTSWAANATPDEVEDFVVNGGHPWKKK